MAEQEISVQDALWLNMDRPNNLMIIDSILWFAQEPDWEAVRRVIQDRLVARFPVFSSKAGQHAGGMVWEPDPEFDLDRHLITAPLPRPASHEELRTYLEAQRRNPLDKTKPLWEFHLIPRALDPSGAEISVVLARFHHSIADGVRLTQVLLGLCDPVEGELALAATVGRRDGGEPSASPAERVVQAVAGLPEQLADVGRQSAESLRAGGEAVVDSASTAAATALNKAREVVAEPLEALSSLPAAVSEAASDAASAIKSAARSGGEALEDAAQLVFDPERLLDVFSVFGPGAEEAANTAVSVAKLALAGPLPAAVWTGEPGTDKRLAAIDALDLDVVKEIGRRSGSTVNDVLLTIVAGALSRYLEGFGESLPEVAWMVPVALRPFDFEMPEHLGNHFALIFFQMPLDIADPVERLAEINRRIGKIKHSHEAVVTFGVQRVVAQSPRDISVFLTNYFANKGLGVLTNVPGPRGQIALAGAPVDGMIGFAPCSGNQPMSVTLFTYNGRVLVGFATDAALVPEPERLLESFMEEARQLHLATLGRELEASATPILA